jgi:N-acetylglucosaminyldiphosphoundecaprenol N-acetyl-beta-D-mannosaminyltransferase
MVQLLDVYWLNKLFSFKEMKKNRTIKLFGFELLETTKSELIQFIVRSINIKSHQYLIALNPIKIIKSTKDRDYRKLLNDATYTFADAIGVVWAVRALNKIKINRIAGFDLMIDLLSVAEKNNYKVAIVGASKISIKKAERKILEVNKGLNLIFCHHGYFKKSEEGDVMDSLIKLEPDMIFVGMGTGRQEAFLSKLLSKKKIPFSMTVGGSFDVISGVSPRAPEIICKIGFEWLYRLVLQPWRYRVMLALPQFFIKVLFHKYKNDKE